MTEIGYLALRLVLTETAVFRNGFTPLHVDSETAISGRTFRGMLATAIQRRGRNVDKRINHWVAGGKHVRFAPGLPRLEPSEDEDAFVGVPAPVTLHRKQPSPGESEVLTDLITHMERAEADLRQAEPAGKKLGGYVTPALGHRIAVHAHTEQYLGTGRGGEPFQGVPFLTTMVDAGQVFETRWQLSAASQGELDTLAEEITDVLTCEGLVLGTGSTRAHGGRPRIGPADSDQLMVERRIAPDVRSWPEGEERDLVLLAPALLVDRHGEPRPDRLGEQVAELCTRVLGPDAVTVVRALVEPEAVQGYHTMYRSAMAARWAAAAGSMVRLKARREISAEEIRALEAETVGQRAVDGCGCFALLRSARGVERHAVPQELHCRPGVELALPDGTEPTADPETVLGALSAESGEDAAASSPAHPDVTTLQDWLFEAAMAEPVRARARELAVRLKEEKLPTPSLLGRLREVAAQPDQDPAQVLTRLAGVAGGVQQQAEPFKAFTKVALTQTDRPCVPRGQDPETAIPLREWLHQAATQRAHWWETYGPKTPESLLLVDLAREQDHGPSRAAQTWLQDDAKRARLALLLITTWLAEAARRKRGADDRQGEE